MSSPLRDEYSWAISEIWLIRIIKASLFSTLHWLTPTYDYINIYDKHLTQDCIWSYQLNCRSFGWYLVTWFCWRYCPLLHCCHCFIDSIFLRYDDRPRSTFLMKGVHESLVFRQSEICPFDYFSKVLAKSSAYVFICLSGLLSLQSVGFSSHPILTWFPPVRWLALWFPDVENKLQHHKTKGCPCVSISVTEWYKNVVIFFPYRIYSYPIG